MDPRRIPLNFLVAFQCIGIAIPCAVAFAASNSVDDNPAAWEFTDGTITVTCVDPNEQPIAGAELEMASWEYDWPPELQRERVRARTDAEGRHTFTQISGLLNYAVYALSGEIGCWEASIRAKPSQKQVNVIMKLDVYHSVFGRVVNGRGEPVPGVEIANRGAILGATTDNDGRFRVRHITDQQEFRFYKPGYGWINSGLVPTIRVFELIYPDGGLCEFTVMDSNRKPVSGAKVSYDCGNVYYGGGAIASVITDEQGKAMSTWIAVNQPTEVFAYYERDGYAWSCKETLTVHETETAKIVLEPKATARIERSTSTSAASAANRFERLDTPNGTVSGKVIMADTGEPVVASIAFDRSHEWVRDSQGTSNERGEFRIDGIVPGDYYFTAFPRDPTLYTIGGLTRISVAEDKPATDLVIKVAKGCVVRGDVRSADGLPVPDAHIYIRPGVENHYVPYWTDSNGHFFAPHQIHPDKRLTIEAQGPRGLHAKHEIGPLGEGTISEPVQITIDNLYLKPSDAGTIRGVVIDENNNPVTAVKVSLPPSVAPETSLTDDNGAFAIAVGERGKALFTVQSERAVLLNGVHDTDRYDFEILEGADIANEDSVPTMNHVIRIRDPQVKHVAGHVSDEQGNPLNARLEIYVGDCMGGGQVHNGNFLKLGCMKPLIEGPVLLEFTLEGYQARVLESGRDFELGDTHIPVVMKKGPFEPFTSVFAAVTSYPIDDANKMANSDRILNNVGEYWRLAKGPGGNNPEMWLVVRDETGTPVTHIKTQMFIGPTVHSAADEKTYASSIVSLNDAQGHYTLKNGHVFVWADGKAKVFLPHPNPNRLGEPAFVTLVREATLSVKVVDSAGAPIKGARVSLDYEKEDWPRYIETGPALPATDASGKMDYTKLPPGSYEINAWAQYYFSTVRGERQKITLEPGEARDLTLVLKPQ